MNVNLTNSANVVFGEPGPTSLESLEQMVKEWNAEAIAYGDLDCDDGDLPHIAVVGDEVRYYSSNAPGDYEVIGIVIEHD